MGTEPLGAVAIRTAARSRLSQSMPSSLPVIDFVWQKVNVAPGAGESAIRSRAAHASVSRCS